MHCGSSTPQVFESHSWYNLEGQSHKWRSMKKNRTNSSWEGDPRKKEAMAWSCHENGWSTHSETSAALESCGIQNTWQTKDELERCGKERPPKNGIKLGRGWSISARKTFVASTCSPMHRWCLHRWCWINQGQGQCIVWSDAEHWACVRPQLEVARWSVIPQQPTTTMAAESINIPSAQRSRSLWPYSAAPLCHQPPPCLWLKVQRTSPSTETPETTESWCHPDRPGLPGVHGRWSNFRCRRRPTARPEFL